MKRIGRYEILEELGEGGMGVVHLALDRSLERKVAVKTLNIQLAGDDASRKRFLRAARVAASISHRNVVTIYELGEEEGIVFIAMEYLEGEDLQQKIERGAKMSLEKKLEILTDVCRGLAHAHAKNFTHRDIKPSNIFICETGEAKVLDFGLAYFSTSTLTKAGQLIGTPRYMAPEQITAASDIDPRTDIFSLGTVMYELLTHKKAFTAESVEELTMEVVHERPEPLDRVDPSVPSELSAIVAKAYEKNPADRYQSVDELQDELSQFQHFLLVGRERLCTEVRGAIEELSSLVGQSRRLMEDTASNLTKDYAATKLSSLRNTLARVDLSRAELVNLRDDVKEECWRLGSLVARAKRDVERRPARQAEKKISDPGRIAAVSGNESIHKPALPSQSTESAETNYLKAVAEFSRGDLARCLRLLSIALKQDPHHDDAKRLAERIRLATIERVERQDQQHARVVLNALSEPAQSGDEVAPDAAKRPGTDVSALSEWCEALMGSDGDS